MLKKLLDNISLAISGMMEDAQSSLDPFWDWKKERVSPTKLRLIGPRGKKYLITITEE